MIELGANRYGKRAIRLVKVVRDPAGHRVRDLTVDVALEGDFATAHTAGDNSLVVATDTMKNTVYALAADGLTGAIESFGTILATHFASIPQVRTGDDRPARAPLGADRRPGRARSRRVPPRRRRHPDGDGRGDPGPTTVVESGLEDLVVMKTTRSAFTGFARDRYTTLPEAPDRIMATKVTATWRHAGATPDWDASHAAISATLLEVFAEHQSESVQHSIWVMANAMLQRHEEIDEVRMTLPNLHHWAVDLAPHGGENRGEVFVATTEPHGLIEATVRRAVA